jgi:argininosuccinate lyase
MKSYSFSADLTQVIVSTLGALPWRDVHQIMGALVAEIQRQDAPPQKPMQPTAPLPPDEK